MILLIIVLSSQLCIGDLYGDYKIYGHTVCERATPNYNFELEFIAPCHANTCKYESDKYQKGLNLSVGQNLDFNSCKTAIHMQDMINITLSEIKGWYDKVKDFKTNELDRFSEGSQGVAQIVWADKEYIGSGFTVSYDYEWYHYYLACNYGGKDTEANRYATPKTDAVCSKCPADRSCNKNYTSACVKVIPITEVDRGDYGRSSKLTFVTIFGTNIKLQDLSVCLVVTIWSLFTKMLL